MLFYGPSNDGFTDPASLTAHLIGLATMDFILIRNTTADRLMEASGINKLYDALSQALGAAEEELAKRKKLYPKAAGFYAPPGSHLRAKAIRHRRSTALLPNPETPPQNAS
jgi:hypothetical protein